MGYTAGLPEIPAKYPDTAGGGQLTSGTKTDVVPGAEARAYQRPHGSRAVTATAANSSVRYAIDRWNRRIGAVLSRGDDPPDPPALGGATRPSKPPWAVATRVFSWWASTTNQAPSAAARTP